MAINEIMLGTIKTVMKRMHVRGKRDHLKSNRDNIMARIIV